MSTTTISPERLFRSIVTTYHSSLRTQNNGIVTFRVEMLQKTRQCTSDAIDLWKEVLCSRRMTLDTVSLESCSPCSTHSPVMMATRSFLLFSPSRPNVFAGVAGVATTDIASLE